MINALSIISHTSLFKVNAIPGNVFVLYRYMMGFYTLRFDTPLFDYFDEKFTFSIPLNQRFEEMGYFTMNFIPL